MKHQAAYWYFYGILDSRIGKFIYVGETRNPAQRRVSLIGQFGPQYLHFVILQTSNSVFLRERDGIVLRTESEWIKKFWDEGHPLVNKAYYEFKEWDVTKTFKVNCVGEFLKLKNRPRKVPVTVSFIIDPERIAKYPISIPDYLDMTAHLDTVAKSA